jgi:hypothetical protein
MYASKPNFWTWFSQIAPRLAEKLDDASLGNQLDRALRREVGNDLSWELGPWEGDMCYLAISPQGDRSLVGKAEAFVASAPEIQGWKLLVGRQKKAFADDLLEMELPDLGATEVGRWRFWLERSTIPNRAVIVVFPAGAQPAPAEDLVACAEIVLDSLLGEMLRVHHVEEIMVARSVVDQQSGIQPLNLADELKEFLSSNSIDS